MEDLEIAICSNCGEEIKFEDEGLSGTIITCNSCKKTYLAEEEYDWGGGRFYTLNPVHNS